METVAEKTLEQKMEEEYIPMIEKMIEKEKEHQQYLSQEIERMKRSKYGKFMNFIFPYHNDNVDDMILVIHSFVKESERLQAHMECRVREYKKYFLNQN
jgi:hypothetical protein